MCTTYSSTCCYQLVRLLSMPISFLITLLVARSEFMVPFDLRFKYEGEIRGWHVTSCLALNYERSVYSAHAVIAGCFFVIFFFLLIGGLWSYVAGSLYLWLQSTFFRNVYAFLHTSVKSKTVLQNHLGNEFSVYSVISSEFLAFLCIFREGDAASSSASFLCG